MPPDVQAKVFQPFFATKPTGDGTGLGLSLSHNLVTQGHGGTLTVQSQPSYGTTFSIRLPAAAAWGYCRAASYTSSVSVYTCPKWSVASMQISLALAEGVAKRRGRSVWKLLTCAWREGGPGLQLPGIP